MGIQVEPCALGHPYIAGDWGGLPLLFLERDGGGTS